MAKDKDKFDHTSTQQNMEAGKDKVASQQDPENGLLEPAVTNTPQEDKTMADSAQIAVAGTPADPKIKAQAKADAAAEIHNELYQTLKSGEDYPGYTIVPADVADKNPTVDKVISVHGSDAVVKLKNTAKNFANTQLGRNLGLVEGQAARDIEEGKA